MSMDIGRVIRERVREALRRVGDEPGEADGTNIAIASSVDASGHSTSVYSDNDVTIIERDGERRVIRHARPGEGPSSSEAR